MLNISLHAASDIVLVENRMNYQRQDIKAGTELDPNKWL
jgi:hypothetical protein